MKFHAFYFSATGNTEKALRRAERELRAAGHEVKESIVTAASARPEPDYCDCVIAAFPVLAKAPPAMFSKFLKRLPRGERSGGGRIKAAVLAVDGGGGGWAGNRAAGILEKRGYEVVSVAKAHYPSNWAQVNGVFTEEEAARVMATGERTAAEFGSKLARGENSPETLTAPKDILDLILPQAYGLAGRRFLGKLYYADQDCNSCGLCARACPSGTILLSGGKGAKPYWKSNCESCNRCINICPKAAIVSSIGRIVAIVAAVVASAWVLIWAYRKFAYPFMAGGLPAALAVTLDVLIIAAIVIASHVVAIGPFDAFVLRWLQRILGIRRFFALSYTKGKRKYAAEGFRP
jgi:ferredoxin